MCHLGQNHRRVKDGLRASMTRDISIDSRVSFPIWSLDENLGSGTQWHERHLLARSTAVRPVHDARSIPVELPNLAMSDKT